MKKTLSVMLACAIACSALVGCGASGKGNTDDASSTAQVVETVDPEAALKEMPEGVKLDDKQMMGVATAYAEYMTEALGEEGYIATVRFEADGTVHFDGIRHLQDGSDETVPDLKVFKNVGETFAYLYHTGQVDLEGNLLVSVSEGVQESVESAAQDAESIAQENIDIAEGKKPAPESEQTAEGETAETAESEAASSEAASEPEAKPAE